MKNFMNIVVAVVATLLVGCGFDFSLDGKCFLGEPCADLGSDTQVSEEVSDSENADAQTPDEGIEVAVAEVVEPMDIPDTEGEVEAPDVLDTDSNLPDEITPPADADEVDEPDELEPETADSEIPPDVTDPPPDEGEDTGKPEDISDPPDNGPNTDIPDVTNPCEGLDCDDGNLCTDDSCDPDSGCINNFNNKPCEDGNLCTQADACLEGICFSGENKCECEQDTDCVEYEDGNLCNGTLVCFAHHCIVAEETKVTCDQSQNPSCKFLECVPESGECMLVNQANFTSCDDLEACTGQDRCDSGHCAGLPMNCDDSNPCTTDSCDPQIGCRNEFNTEPCTDDNVCTEGDTCSDGTCQPGSPKECKDDNKCTVESCDADTGCESTPTNCDDSDACTTDACIPATGCEHSQISCDDGNDCTADACNPTIGCQNIAVGNGSPCDDNSVCTTNDVCFAGLCIGKNIECNDSNICTDDSCDAQVGCRYKNNESVCDDEDPCTTWDWCEEGKCTGKPVNCDDGEPCTDDFCDPFNPLSAWGVCVNALVDTDGDALCDANDPDDDNDGIEDVQDNCPVVANSDQKNIDDDADGDACDLSKDCYEYGVANQYLPATFVNTNSCAEVCLTVSGKLACLYTKQIGNSTCTKDQDNDGVAIAQGDCNGNTTNVVFQCHPLPPEDKPEAPDNYGCSYNDWTRHDPPPPPAEDP